MIEAVMLWNEPNNKSHWAFEEDPDWAAFAEMTILASQAIAAENPQLVKALGGISPIDPLFIQNMTGKVVLAEIDAVAVHGFPLDWNHWQLNDWPEKLKEIQAVTNLPVWVSEVGMSSFGAGEVLSSKKFLASQASFLKNPKAVPRSALVPVLLTRFTWFELNPYSAE